LLYKLGIAERAEPPDPALPAGSAWNRSGRIDKSRILNLKYIDIKMSIIRDLSKR
jgi:hypothetical protein